MSIWVIVPILTFLSLWNAFTQRGHAQLSVFLAAVWWGVILVFITELLSLFSALHLSGLIAAWSIALAAVVVWQRPSWKSPSAAFLQWPILEKIVLGLLVLLAAAKGTSAFLSAPNTWDSMTYHLSRVEHWVQNQTLAHYPTNMLRQLYSNPFSEYVLLNFRILSSGDYFANAVQWVSAIGSWGAVGVLARFLGGSRLSQLSAALLAATLPMGLMQSTSTQTDYVVTFWLLCFVILLWKTHQDRRPAAALAAGAALGLCLLTKGTAYIFAPVWFLIYLAAAVKSKDKTLIKWAGLILAVAIVLNLGYGIRNALTFGRPNWTHASLTTGEISFEVIAGNLLRNTALHLGTIQPVNSALENIMFKAPQKLGLNFNNPHASFGEWPLTINKISRGEDDAGNAVYVLMFLMTLIWIIFFHRKLPKTTLIFALGLVIAGIMFCAFVRYQPWNSRFHLPLFVLSCALTGVVLARAPRTWVGGLLGLFFMASLPWVLKGYEHPLIGERNIFKTARMEEYFTKRQDLMLPFAVTSRVLASSGCREIGIIQGEDGWEYPWWILLRQNYGANLRFEHVMVENESKKAGFPRGPFMPCAVISYGSEAKENIVMLSQGPFFRAWHADLPQGTYSIFIPPRP